MRMSFRWFGESDPVPLEHIRQIPGVHGIVSALYDVAVGETWPRDKIDQLIATIADAGMLLSVVESIPVHEEIKLGSPNAEKLLDQYAASVRNIGEAGVRVLCYNFMPVFDWTRTDLSMRLPDGSTALAYDDDDLAKIDLAHGTRDLPGWGAAYDARTLAGLLDAYRAVSAEQLWDNLSRFLEYVVPVAEEYGVQLAIHPDDPPWPIFGIPRIITDESAIDRLLAIVNSPANGITFCTGSLGASAGNNLPIMARKYGEMKRIHFAHCRNVRRTGDRAFNEVPHPREYGHVDVLEVLRALVETGFDGPMRPDHGRMIWGETGRPGYGLYDRALGATYLYGVWEALSANRR